MISKLVADDDDDVGDSDSIMFMFKLERNLVVVSKETSEEKIGEYINMAS